MGLNYRELVAIDAGALDVEWTEAPSRYMEVVEAQAEASSMVDQLKDKLEAHEATLASEVRKDPEAFGIIKATDTAIKEYVAAAQTTEDIRDELRLARKQNLILQGLMTAMDHRRRALENLVELHTRNYQAEPRPKSAVSHDAAAKMTMQTTHDAIGSRMGRRG